MPNLTSHCLLGLHQKRRLFSYDGDAKAQIEAFLQAAETWGWVSTEKKNAALVHLSRGLDRNTFNALKNELKPNPGEVESEMAALLKHFAKKQGFMDE